MKTSIATVCLSGNLLEKLEAIASAGFKAVEIFENDLIAYPASPRDVRRVCDDLGLTVVTCQPFREFEGLPPDKRVKALERAERKFDLLQELGSDLLFVCSSVSAEAGGGIDRLAEDFALLGERAAKRKMRVGYEALAWGRQIFDYRDAWEVVRRSGQDSVGIVLDSFHIQSRGTDLKPIRTIPKDRIFLVQIADAPKLEMDYLSWSRHWRCLPGQGDFDLVAFMDALIATGYDSYLSLEIFNDRFRAGSARSVARDGHRSLIYLLDEASRRHGAPVNGTVMMPPPESVQAIEFIEFAVHEGDRPQFEALLSHLGFAKTGRHKSKNVNLWTQGGIRIVVNSDDEGFAHSYQITHGTSVCAMALRVPDAGATIARAKALLDVPHEGAVGPGELNIPAIRGVGGSLLYFVDGKSALGGWSTVDFEPVAGDKSDAGLFAVDHVSQTMFYEEMLTWLLFYTSLFDTRRTQSQAVVDPGGIVQSQVIESGALDRSGHGLRMVLNGSQSNQTLSSRFVYEFFGSGVQHIALATDDIRTTVAKLVANGIQMLEMPKNYYDDLASRGDLPDTDLSALKALNILYDSDAAGSYFQAYTKTMEGGFFFEIVQRDGGYKGYGASNAAIRLNAQSYAVSPPADVVGFVGPENRS